MDPLPEPPKVNGHGLFGLEWSTFFSRKKKAGADVETSETLDTTHNVTAERSDSTQSTPKDPGLALDKVQTPDETHPRPNATWYDGFVSLFVWYPKSMPRDEKLLVFKLDLVILLYTCTSYFTKSLDKSNITNAYNTKMEEDINFSGNDLSYAKSLYSAGYIVSMFTGMLLVTRPWARLTLPILETIWGVLTFCESAVTRPSHMFALRFLIGLAEGPIFPSVVYTLGSWYKREELYRRVMAFSVSSSIGGMFSGYLQTAAYETLSGKGGKSGWQWGFIIDGIFTVPIAIIGFGLYPGSLEQARSVWWLKKSELALAEKRMRSSGVRKSVKLSLGLIKRVVLRWHVHYYTAFWVLLNVEALPSDSFALWLRSRPDLYSISDRNNYPTIASAVSIVAQFLFAGLSDTFSPYVFLTITQITQVISNASLVAWNLPIGYKWFCYMLMGFVGVNQAIVSGQINRSTRRDAEERAVVLGFSDAVSQAINIWTNIVFFPTKDQPKFHTGFIGSLVGSILMLVIPVIAYFGDRWDDKHYAAQDAAFIDDESVTSSDIDINEIEETKNPVTAHIRSIHSDEGTPIRSEEGTAPVNQIESPVPPDNAAHLRDKEVF